MLLAQHAVRSSSAAAGWTARQCWCGPGLAACLRTGWALALPLPDLRETVWLSSAAAARGARWACGHEHSCWTWALLRQSAPLWPQPHCIA